jgi:peptidoglycan hydrolase CwlO-like protein
MPAYCRTAAEEASDMLKDLVLPRLGQVERNIVALDKRCCVLASQIELFETKVNSKLDAMTSQTEQLEREIQRLSSTISSIQQRTENLHEKFDPLGAHIDLLVVFVLLLPIIWFPWVGSLLS